MSAFTLKELAYLRKGTFPRLLMHILSDKDAMQGIDWLLDGKTVAIVDRGHLVSRVLPRFFKHLSYENFIRLFEFWGFRKVQDHTKEWEMFRHELFQKDHPDLCKKMRVTSYEKALQQQVHRFSKQPSSSYHSAGSKKQKKEHTEQPPQYIVAEILINLSSQQSLVNTGKNEIHHHSEPSEDECRSRLSLGSKEQKEVFDGDTEESILAEVELLEKKLMKLEGEKRSINLVKDRTYHNPEPLEEKNQLKAYSSSKMIPWVDLSHSNLGSRKFVTDRVCHYSESTDEKCQSTAYLSSRKRPCVDLGRSISEKQAEVELLEKKLMKLKEEKRSINPVKDRTYHNPELLEEEKQLKAYSSSKTLPWVDLSHSNLGSRQFVTDRVCHYSESREEKCQSAAYLSSRKRPCVDLGHFILEKHKFFKTNESAVHKSNSSQNWSLNSPIDVSEDLWGISRQKLLERGSTKRNSLMKYHKQIFVENHRKSVDDRHKLNSNYSSNGQWGSMYQVSSQIEKGNACELTSEQSYNTNHGSCWFPEVSNSNDQFSQTGHNALGIGQISTPPLLHANDELSERLNRKMKQIYQKYNQP